MTCRCGSDRIVLMKQAKDRRLRWQCQECGKFHGWAKRTVGNLERAVEGVYEERGQLSLEDAWMEH